MCVCVWLVGGGQPFHLTEETSGKAEFGGMGSSLSDAGGPGVEAGCRLKKRKQHRPRQRPEITQACCGIISSSGALSGNMCRGRGIWGAD